MAPGGKEVKRRKRKKVKPVGETDGTATVQVGPAAGQDEPAADGDVVGAPTSPKGGPKGKKGGSKGKSKKKGAKGKKPAKKGTKRWREEQAELAAEEERSAEEGSRGSRSLGDYEATEEELEEERQDAAVRLIQGLYRAKKARQTIRVLVRANYVKEYDYETGLFMYRNKKTGEVSPNKPKALGAEDLEDPTQHHAPRDYVVRKTTLRQFAYVVTVTTFGTPKIAPLPDAVKNDYDDLVEILTNPFLCQFDAADCVFSKDPSLEAFRHNFDSIRRRMPEDEDAVFLLYLCTQCVTVQHDINQGGYFMMADSQYRGTSRINRSALAVSELASLVKSIPCSQKFVVLDISHNVRPEQVWLFSKFVYPPRSTYKLVAEKGECVVLGSCRLGPTLDAAGTSDDPEEMEEECGAVEGSFGGSFVGSLKEGGSADDGGAAAEEKQGAAEEAKDGEEGKSRSRRGGFFIGRRKHNTAVVPEPGDQPQGLDGEDSEKDEPSGEGGEDGANCGDGESTGDGASVASNGSKGKKKNSRSKKGTRSKKAKREKDQGTRCAPPGWNSYMARRAERRRLRAMKMATFETVKYADRNSLFGEFFLKGLAGLAADVRKNRINARQLFGYVREAILREMSTRYSWLKSKQTPQLLVATTNKKLPQDLDRKTTVCPIPCVLPPPKPPTCEEALHNSLRLHWLNPAFSGAPPLKYEIQVRGVAKFNSEWERTSQWAEITVNNFHVTHLVTGLKVQFRVRALNYGGWGGYSEPSEFFTPDTARTQTVQETMRAAAVNGLRSVIAEMRRYPENSEALMLGCWIICKEACSNNGFKRCSVGKEVVEVRSGCGSCAQKGKLMRGHVYPQVVLPAMRTFPLNTRLQQYACLALGWACYGHHAAAEYALELGVERAIDDAIRNCPMDTAVHGNSTWARANITPASHEWPKDVHGKLDGERRGLAVAFSIASKKETAAPPPLPALEW